MSAKKSMFIIWIVASLLWACFSFYMFRLDNVLYAYRTHDRFMEKVARGRQADPFRYEYNLRAYERAGRATQDANRRMSLFLLVGLGLPGVMLAIGTAALSREDKARLRKKA